MTGDTIFVLEIRLSMKERAKLLKEFNALRDTPLKTSGFPIDKKMLEKIHSLIKEE